MPRRQSRSARAPALTAWVLATSLLVPLALGAQDAAESPSTGPEPASPSTHPRFLDVADAIPARPAEPPPSDDPGDESPSTEPVEFQIFDVRRREVVRTGSVPRRPDAPTRSRPGSRGTVCEPGGGGGGAAIFGADDRVEVSNTTAYPWRVIGQVYSWFHEPDPSDPNDGPDCIGTGALVGPCHVLTAAHVIWNQDPLCGEIGFAYKIEFAPGQYRDSSGILRFPYGKFDATRAMVYSDWAGSADADSDQGMFQIGRDVGNTIGWFGYSTADSQGEIRNTAGYPGDGNGDQLFDAGEIHCEGSELARYQIDTNSGHSGAPVWRLENDDRYIHIVHTGVSTTPVTCWFWATNANRGTRITAEKFDAMQTFLQEECQLPYFELLAEPIPPDLLPGLDPRVTLDEILTRYGIDRVRFTARVRRLFGTLDSEWRLRVFVRRAGESDSTAARLVAALIVSLRDVDCGRTRDYPIDLELPPGLASGEYLVEAVVEPEDQPPAALESADLVPMARLVVAAPVELRAEALDPEGDPIDDDVVVVLAAPGATSRDVEARVRMESSLGASGAQGWAFSLESEGALTIDEATVTDTAADLAPAGYRTDGFVRIDQVDPATSGGRRGVVCAVLLSTSDPAVTLPPSGTETILQVRGRLELADPGISDPVVARLRVVDPQEPGLRGASTTTPVPTRVRVDGESVRPFVAEPVRFLVERVGSPVFVRGDANGDRRFDLSDAVKTLEFLFLGATAPECLDAADSNDDGRLDLSDALFGLNHLFLGGEAPSAPYPACGLDPTPDALSCAFYDGCRD